MGKKKIYVKIQTEKKHYNKTKLIYFQPAHIYREATLLNVSINKFGPKNFYLATSSCGPTKYPYRKRVVPLKFKMPAAKLLTLLININTA